MRQILTTALELAGAAAMTVGAGLAYLPAGFLLGGFFAMAAGYLVADDS